MEDHFQHFEGDITSSSAQGQEGQGNPFFAPVLLFQLSHQKKWEARRGNESPGSLQSPGWAAAKSLSQAGCSKSCRQEQIEKFSFKPAVLRLGLTSLSESIMS